MLRVLLMRSVVPRRVAVVVVVVKPLKPSSTSSTASTSRKSLESLRRPEISISAAPARVPIEWNVDCVPLIHRVRLLPIVGGVKPTGWPWGASFHPEGSLFSGKRSEAILEVSLSFVYVPELFLFNPIYRHGVCLVWRYTHAEGSRGLF